MELSMLRFIIHHFLHYQLHSLSVFHCWPIDMQKHFAQFASDTLMHTQYVHIGVLSDLQDFEWRYLRYKQPILGIYLDMNCMAGEHLLDMFNSLRLYNSRYHWLVFDAAGNLNNFERLFENANLSVDAQIAYVAPMPTMESRNDCVYTIYDVYNNGRRLGGKLNVTVDRAVRCDNSKCQLSQYLSDLHKRTKYGNRIVLHDINLRVSNVITQRPLTLSEKELLAFLTSENNTYVDSLVRYSYKVTMVALDYFKCNYTFIHHNVWSYGSETTGGMVNDLINDLADMGSSPFLITESRLQYLSGIVETGGFRMVCMFRTPRNSGTHGGVFLEPFSLMVWLIFAIVLLVASILLWCTFMLENNRMRYSWCFTPSLLTTCLISFGSACFQGSFLIPHSIGGRMLLFTLLLVTFIMYNYYTSVVVSSLLGSPVKSNIKSLARLADSSLDVALDPQAYTFVFLNNSQLPAVRRFVKRKIDDKHNPQTVWQNIDVGLKRVRDEPGFVFVFEVSTGYLLVEKYYEPHQICDLNEIMLRSEKSLHAHTHKNSSYKEFIRLRLTRMLETGAVNRFRRYWIRDRLNCFASNYVIDVGMEYAAPLFFLLLCAYCLAWFVLLLEILCKWYI